MRHSKWALACGLMAAMWVGTWIGSVGGGGGHAVAQQGGLPVRTWPPAPGDIVSLPAAKELPVGTSLGMSGYLYFEVPKDRALVVTDVIGDAGMSNIVYEDLPGKTLVKIAIPGVRGARSEYHSAVGASFAPGSKIVLLNYTANIHMTGYLTAP